MSKVVLHPGDNRVSLRRLIDEGVRVHSVVTDPPYGLVSVQKRFGKEGSAPARKDKNDGSFARLSGGFMGKAWDGSGIERDPEFWALIYEILLPGGYCFAFSGSRTGHWQACAMELAGFVMHPMHGWVYGSGFPKAHAADKAIDKALRVDGAFGDPKSAAHAGWINRGRMRGDEGSNKHEGWQRPWMEDPEQVNNAARKYIPGSPEAAEWEGWAYGTQAQKPALEPIYLGQKPFSEKTGAANLLAHGVGAMNIDGCRVPLMNDDPLQAGIEHTGRNLDTANNEMAWGFKAVDRQAGLGRHPANLILDGSPEVVAMFPTSNGSGSARTLKRATKQGETGWGMNTTGPDQSALRDAGSGSAARFFHQFAPDADPLFYHPKAGKADRAGSRHPTVKPIALMQYLIRHITPPGGVVLDPFAGSGTTAEAARREGLDCILMEAEPEYVTFLAERFGSKPPKQAFAFDDLLGDIEPAPEHSTRCGADHLFGDLP